MADFSAMQAAVKPEPVPGIIGGTGATQEVEPELPQVQMPEPGVPLTGKLRAAIKKYEGEPEGKPPLTGALEKRLDDIDLIYGGINEGGSTEIPLTGKLRAQMMLFNPGGIYDSLRVAQEVREAEVEKPEGPPEGIVKKTIAGIRDIDNAVRASAVDLASLPVHLAAIWESGFIGDYSGPANRWSKAAEGWSSSIRSTMTPRDPNAGFVETLMNPQVVIPNVMDFGLQILASGGVGVGGKLVAKKFITSAAGRNRFAVALASAHAGNMEAVHTYQEARRRGMDPGRAIAAYAGHAALSGALNSPGLAYLFGEMPSVMQQKLFAKMFVVGGQEALLETVDEVAGDAFLGDINGWRDAAVKFKDAFAEIGPAAFLVGGAMGTVGRPPVKESPRAVSASEAEAELDYRSITGSVVADDVFARHASQIIQNDATYVKTRDGSRYSVVGVGGTDKGGLVEMPNGWFFIPPGHKWGEVEAVPFEEIVEIGSRRSVEEGDQILLTSDVMQQVYDESEAVLNQVLGENRLMGSRHKTREDALRLAMAKLLEQRTGLKRELAEGEPQAETAADRLRRLEENQGNVWSGLFGGRFRPVEEVKAKIEEANALMEQREEVRERIREIEDFKGVRDEIGREDALNALAEIESQINGRLGEIERYSQENAELYNEQIALEEQLNAIKKTEAELSDGFIVDENGIQYEGTESFYTMAPENAPELIQDQSQADAVVVQLAGSEAVANALFSGQTSPAEIVQARFEQMGLLDFREAEDGSRYTVVRKEGQTDAQYQGALTAYIRTVRHLHTAVYYSSGVQQFKQPRVKMKDGKPVMENGEPVTEERIPVQPPLRSQVDFLNSKAKNAGSQFGSRQFYSAVLNQSTLYHDLANVGITLNWQDPYKAAEIGSRIMTSMAKAWAQLNPGKDVNDFFDGHTNLLRAFAQKVTEGQVDQAFATHGFDIPAEMIFSMGQERPAGVDQFEVNGEFPVDRDIPLPVIVTKDGKIHLPLLGKRETHWHILERVMGRELGFGDLSNLETMDGFYHPALGFLTRRETMDWMSEHYGYRDGRNEEAESVHLEQWYQLQKDLQNLKIGERLRRRVDAHNPLFASDSGVGIVDSEIDRYVQNGQWWDATVKAKLVNGKLVVEDLNDRHLLRAAQDMNGRISVIVEKSDTPNGKGFLKSSTSDNLTKHILEVTKLVDLMRDDLLDDFPISISSQLLASFENFLVSNYPDVASLSAVPFAALRSKFNETLAPEAISKRIFEGDPITVGQLKVAAFKGEGSPRFFQNHIHKSLLEINMPSENAYFAAKQLTEEVLMPLIQIHGNTKDAYSFARKALNNQPLSDKFLGNFGGMIGDSFYDWLEAKIDIHSLENLADKVKAESKQAKKEFNDKVVTDRVYMQEGPKDRLWKNPAFREWFGKEKRHNPNLPFSVDLRAVDWSKENPTPVVWFRTTSNVEDHKVHARAGRIAPFYHFGSVQSAHKIAERDTYESNVLGRQTQLLMTNIANAFYFKRTKAKDPSDFTDNLANRPYLLNKHLLELAITQPEVYKLSPTKIAVFNQMNEESKPANPYSQSKQAEELQDLSSRILTSMGYDGILYDNFAEGTKDTRRVSVAATEPNSVKYYYRDPNEINFSTDDLRYSRTGEDIILGLFQQSTKDISLFLGSDLPTILHEFAHAWRQALPAASLESARKWAHRGERTPADGTWTERAEERFAEGFLAWATDPKAKAPEGLEQTFKDLGLYTTELYRTARHLRPGVKISPLLSETMEALYTKNLILSANQDDQEEGRRRTRIKESVKRSGEAVNLGGHMESMAEFLGISKAKSTEVINATMEAERRKRRPEYMKELDAKLKEAELTGLPQIDLVDAIIVRDRAIEIRKKFEDEFRDAYNKGPAAVTRLVQLMLKRRAKQDIENYLRVAGDSGRRLQILTNKATQIDFAFQLDAIQKGLGKGAFRTLYQMMENPEYAMEIADQKGGELSPSLWDLYMQAFYSFLLSSPKTLKINTLFTGMWTAWNFGIHRPLAGAVERAMWSTRSVPKIGKLIDAFYYEGNPIRRDDYAAPMLSGFSQLGYAMKKAGKHAYDIVVDSKEINSLESIKGMDILGKDINSWQHWVSRRNTLRYKATKAAVGEKTAEAVRQNSEALIQWLGPWISMPTTLMRASDMFFKTIAAEEALTRLIEVQAESAVPQRGKERRLWVSDKLREYNDVDKIPEHLRAEWFDEIQKAASYNTFMDMPGAATRHILAVRENLPITKLVIPFLNTLVNLGKRGLEMTPIAGIGVEWIYRFDPQFDPNQYGHRRADIVAKQMEGMMMVMAMFLLLDEDDLTGDMPSDPKERSAFLQQGKLPYSIRFGDKWISYQNVEPFNVPLSLVANLRKYVLSNVENFDSVDPEVQKKVNRDLMQASWAFGAMMINNGFMRTYGEYVSARTTEQRQELVGKTVEAAVVPYSGLLRWVQRQSNARKNEEGYYIPMDRETIIDRSFPLTHNVINDMFGLPRTETPRLTVWGEPYAYSENKWWELWWPTEYSQASQDPVDYEVAKVGYYPSMPSGIYEQGGRSYRYSPAVHQQLVLGAGQDSKEAVRRLVNSPVWNRLTPEIKYKRLLSTVEKARERHHARAKAEQRKLGLIPVQIKGVDQ